MKELLPAHVAVAGYDSRRATTATPYCAYARIIVLQEILEHVFVDRNVMTYWKVVLFEQTAWNIDSVDVQMIGGVGLIEQHDCVVNWLGIECGSALLKGRIPPI